MPRRAVVCLVPCLFLLPTAHAARWTRLGPPGGRVTALATAPSAPGIVYAGGAFVYRSPDNGAHWFRMADPFPPRSPSAPEAGINAMAVSPTHPNRVLAATTQGLFLTRNGGVSWQRAGSVTSPVPAVAFGTNGLAAYASTAASFHRSADGGDTWTTAASPGLVTALCVDPLAPNTVLAALGTPASNGRTLLRSTDRGTSWSPFSPLGIALTDLCAGPAGASFYAAAAGPEGGLFRIARDGTATPISGLSSQGVCASPTYPGFLLSLGDIEYGTTPLYRSVDDGAVWTGIRTGFGGRVPLSLAIGAELTPLVGTLRGGVVAADVADTWTPSNAGLNMADIYGAWAHPDRPGSFLAAAGDGLYRTTDAGDSWTRVSASTAGSLIAASPAKVGRIYHTSTSVLSMTDNGGDTWRAAASGLPAAAEVLGILCDPERADVVFVTLADGSVYRSNTTVTAFKKIVPVNGSGAAGLALAWGEPSTLYAALPGIGIKRSTDSGTTWSPRGSIVPEAGILLAVHPSDANVVLRVQPRTDGLTLHRSTDGAATWTQVYTESGASGSGFGATVLEADARHPGRFLLGTTRGLRVSDNGIAWRAEEVSPAGVACVSWAPYGLSGDLLGTAGAGVLLGRPVGQGDADGDGRLTVSDGIRIIAFVLSEASPTPAQLAVMDMDGDGSITSADAALALQSATGP